MPFTLRPGRTCVLALLSVLALALPAAAAGADDGPAIAGSDTRARPLDAPTPAWYTDVLHHRVVAAGPEGVPVPAAADLPASGLTGIRPGGWIVSPSWCTTGFVFDLEGSPVISTAGHCAERGEEVVMLAAPGVLVYVGDAVVSVNRGVGEDFALIEVRPEVADLLDPSMPTVSGPSGPGRAGAGDVVVHAGHGVGVGVAGTPRAGVVTYEAAVGQSGPYGFVGAAAMGDSGSPVRLLSGEAVGNLTHVVVDSAYAPAVVVGTPLERIERLSGATLIPAGATARRPSPLAGPAGATARRSTVGTPAVGTARHPTTLRAAAAPWR